MTDGWIYIADSTGRNARRVTQAPDPHSVAWSPDGKRLAYVSQNSGWPYGFNIAPSSIWVMNLDGTGKTQVTGATQLNTSPVWAADGSGLLFVSGLGGGRDVYYQPLPRSGPPREPPQRITTGLSLHGIAISGDGRRVAYTTFNRSMSIWSIPIPARGAVSSAGAKQITAASERIEAVSVTRDGEWLAFDSDRAGNHDIYSMPAAGGEARQLTRDPADEFNPAWSPDGSEIAFHSWRSGNRDSYVVSADGTRERLIAQYGLPAYDAGVLTQSPALTAYFEATATASGNAKAASNWIMVEALGRLNAAGQSIDDIRITPDALGGLIRLIDSGRITGATAKTVFDRMFHEGGRAETIVEAEGLARMADAGAIESLVSTVLAAHPGPVAQYRAGKHQTLGFLVGQVMKASAGTADPEKVAAAVRRQLDSSDTN